MTQSLTKMIRSAVLALTLLCGMSFGMAETAQARSHFSLSIGVPLGIYSGGYYGGSFGSYYGGGFGGYYRSGWYEPYPYFYGPRYYAPRPVYYSRPYYRPYSYGPIVSLGLFPAYVGDALTYDDRSVYLTAYQRALAAPVGQAMAWNSGNVSGEVTTTRDGWAGQRYCREFSQNVTIGGQVEQAYGTACRTADGDWQLVQNQ